MQYQSPDEEPYYYLSTNDSVEILALTEKSEIIFVRQFRPAVGISMLELPAGYIDLKEKPDDAVKRELTEETGYTCDKIDYLGSFKDFPSRVNTTLHLFFGSNSLLSLDHFNNDHEVVLLTQKNFISLIEKGDFLSISGIAAFYLTKIKGFL